MCFLHFHHDPMLFEKLFVGSVLSTEISQHKNFGFLWTIIQDTIIAHLAQLMMMAVALRELRKRCSCSVNIAIITVIKMSNSSCTTCVIRPMGLRSVLRIHQCSSLLSPVSFFRVLPGVKKNWDHVLIIFLHLHLEKTIKGSKSLFSWLQWKITDMVFEILNAQIIHDSVNNEKQFKIFRWNQGDSFCC